MRTRNLLDLALLSEPIYRVRYIYPGVDSIFFLFPTNLPPGPYQIPLVSVLYTHDQIFFPLPSIPQPAHITMSKTFSKDDVASHSKGDSLWIVIDEDVYDVTKFQDEHPGKFSL